MEERTASGTPQSGGVRPLFLAAVLAGFIAVVAAGLGLLEWTEPRPDLGPLLDESIWSEVPPDGTVKVPANEYDDCTSDSAFAYMVVSVPSGEEAVTFYEEAARRSGWTITREGQYRGAEKVVGDWNFYLSFKIQDTEQFGTEVTVQGGRPSPRVQLSPDGRTYADPVAAGDVVQPLYAGWLPGPWLDLTDYADEAETELYRARCELCGNEVSITVDYADEERSMEEFRQVEASARQEWERHVAEAGSQSVRYFLLPGAGPYKSSRVGTWADVVEAIPYLFFPGHPMPPMADLNRILMQADGHSGMGGGVEWPRYELTDTEYQEVRATLVERLSLIDTDGGSCAPRDR